jgi:hypothetical protein
LNGTARNRAWRPAGQGRVVGPDQGRDSLSQIVQTHVGALAGAAVCPAQLLRMAPGEAPLPATGVVAAEFVFCRRIVTGFGAVAQSSRYRPGE